MSSFTYNDYPYNYDEEKYFVSNSYYKGANDKKQDERISANEASIKTNYEMDAINRALDAKQEEHIQNLLEKIKKLQEEVDFLQENGGSGGGTPIISNDIVLYPIDQENNLTDEEKESLTIKSTDNYNSVIAKLASAIQTNKDIVDGDLFG